MSTQLVYNVNNWLEKTIVSNNGELYTYDEYDITEYKYFHFCDELFESLKKIITNNGNELLEEDVFKDRLTYLVYKYSQQ